MFSSWYHQPCLLLWKSKAVEELTAVTMEVKVPRVVEELTAVVKEVKAPQVAEELTAVVKEVKAPQVVEVWVKVAVLIQKTKQTKKQKLSK